MTILTKEIDYQAGDRQLTGYLAFDTNSEDPRPGVLIVHEWWGHGPYVRERAEQLAADGFIAFALDMYGSGRYADNPTDAGELMTEVRADPDKIEQRFQAAYEVLRAQPQVDANNINAAGYCFGGAVVLAMARAGKDLKGVASFHGLLETDTPMQADTFHGAIAVFNGADDPMVTPETVKAFESEMAEAHVRCSMTNYLGVLHGFTNPRATEHGEHYDMPLRYDEAADKDSYQGMIELFNA